MSNGGVETAFRRVTTADVNEQLQLVVEEQLRALIAIRAPGHCMRVSDLDPVVMLAVARGLRATLGTTAQVHVLSAHARNDDPLLIGSSKLVELRNPPADGAQRPPLLVLVPNDVRVPAEDSFAEATFEQVSVATAYQDLRARLLTGLPGDLERAIPEVLRLIEERDWRWADAVAAVRFLLSIRLNGADPQVVGASLCEFGLVPDFYLLENPAEVAIRLAKNLECVRALTLSAKSDRGRVLDLKLKDAAFRAKLGDYLCNVGLEDPLAWTGRIVADRARWEFTFDKWKFEDGSGFTQNLQVEVLETGLPLIGENDPPEGFRARKLVGQQVLLVGKNGPKSFSVKFRSDPAPDRVSGVDHFRLQIIAREGGATTFTKRKKVWNHDRPVSASFTGLQKGSWEEGWHFVRVLPYTADNQPVPIVDERGKPVPLIGDPDGGAPNESDLFYVVVTDELEVEVPQRSVPKFPSLSHALIHQWFKAVADEGEPGEVLLAHRAWAEGEGRGELLEAKFNGEGVFHLPVSRTLKALETRMLAAPDEAVSWRLSVLTGEDPVISADSVVWPPGAEVEEFRASRRALWEKLRGEENLWTTETAELFPLRDEIAALGERYLALLAHAVRRVESAPADATRSALTDLQTLLALDAVTVTLADARGAQRTALLIGPTHPLRLLWLGTWLTLANAWAERSKGARDYLGATRDTLFTAMSLANFPAVFPTAGGRLLTAVDNVHPFWTAYTPSTETDARGLLASLCTALGLPEPNIGSGTLGSEFLADRLRRYLVQHPYIQTLTLNCFNAGRGRLLADALLALQKVPELRNLRYTLRLFVPEPDAAEIGEDLHELISPTSTLTAAEADAFATPTGNHLAPKLAYAVRATEDFCRAPDEFPAHISMLFDVFPAQGVSAHPPRRQDESAPVHGLLQDFAVSYVEEGEHIAWHRRPRHGTAVPLPGAPELSTLLASLAEALSSAAATVATGQGGLALRPVSTLVLEPEHRALLHQVHEVSDWVFTIDKNLGIEFFDHAQSSLRPEYLIDHSPALAANSGRRVVITSRSQTEVRALLERVLVEHRLGDFQDRSPALLSELRALSGRLALKLASSPTHRAEALGLALAKMFLEYQEAFRDQAVVPLDAHLDLYRALQRGADDLVNELSLRRTDLALFDFDAATRTLTCSLVEVKCYQSAGGIGAWTQLKADIAEQVTESERALRQHFDPEHAGANDRPDRVMKTQEFIALLEFYLDRAFRLRLLTPAAHEEAKFFLRTMEGGYRLRFTRSALVFDFDKEGSDEFVEENGIEFHRVGVDRIRQLLDSLPARSRQEETRLFAVPTETVSTVPADRPTGTVPKLTHAAFLREGRDRTVAWETLGRRTEEAVVPVDQAEPQIPRTPVAPKNPRMVPVERDSVGEPVFPPPPASTIVAPPVGPAVVQQLPPAPDPSSASAPPAHDVILGVTGDSPQFGILGKVMGRTVALDLNQTHTISLFGVQGGGKSYTLGSIIEMATLRLPGLNALPRPLATVVFHYSQTQDYKPEFTAMRRPNGDAQALGALAAEYGAHPAALRDMVLLVPEAKLAARRAEYPDIEIVPLKFSSAELQAGHWRFLMGAVGNQATYIRRLNQIMRGLRDGLTLAGLREAVAAANLPESLRELATMRLDLAETYIDDAARLSAVVRPGRLVIVDLRDEFIEKDEALGLFVVLLQLFADATVDGAPFNKLVVFDEAHKYIDNPDLISGLIGVVREMRHKGTSILLASQDPKSLPISVIELSSQIILHRFNSPEWLRHIQKANAALLSLNPEQLARLQPGEALVWSSKASDPAFSREAVKINCRPRATEHGGDTKTAV